jgi:vitamin B12 transporter
VRASAGTGFKAPSLYELSPEAFGGNPDLDPETSWGADLGIEQRFDSDRGLARATLFANEVDDLIVAMFDTTTGSFVNFNVDRATARGVELEGTYRPARAWTVRAGYTYTDSDARGNPAGFGLADGEPLLRRPENKGSVGAAWSGGRATMSADLRYVGTRRDLDPVTFEAVEAPSYVVADLAGSVEVGGGVRLHARLDNALDEDYQDVLGFASPGRSAYIGLCWGFSEGRGTPAGR